MEVELQDNLTDDVKSENIEEKNEMKIEEENYLIEDDNLLEDEEQIESLMVIEESNESIKETLEEMNVKEQNIKTEVENKEIIMDVADIKSESIDILKHIDENFIEKEESISNDKISVNDIKKNHKRKQIDAGWSSDEDFFGFTETEITSGLLKKIKSESMSDEFESQESGLKDEEEVFDEQVLAPIMPVTGTPKSEKRTVRAVPLSDPIYRKPFEYGWKRELVLRANPDPSKEKGEVYYITPSGKKLRTRTEIQMNLHDGLILTNFTLTKEALGADPQDEIIRSAKISTTSSRRSQQVEQVQPQVNTSIPLGKRIPKPKQPKGSSPTPPSFIRSTPKTIRTNNTPTVKKSDTKDIGKISDSDSKLNIITPIKTNKPGGGGGKPTPKTTKSASTSTLTSMSSSSSITAGTLAPIPLMTGDASPVQKRRLTGKQNSGKFSNDLITTSTTVQTPIASPIQQTDNLSPTIGRITSPFNNNNKLNNNLKSRKNFGPNMGMGDVSFSTNFFTNVSIGYDVLLHTFQYLKVQELLRASCVCRLWNQAGNHVNLWKTVRMKNSQVNDWDGMANTLIKNGTKHLDLKKMLGPKNSDESWEKFSKIIGNVQNLESIDLCKCSVHVVEKLFESNQNLKIINAVTLKEEEINLGKLSNLKNLTELRIKSSTGLNINNLISIKDLVQIRHLSLTSVRSLGLTSIEIIGNLINLESLELGECCDFELNFVDNVLPKLINLERLRLEKGQDNCCTFDILTGISKMVNLIQLELINFDIRNNFDDHLSNCKNIKKLLMIPTYVKQSATTNQIVLNGVMKLHETLTNFTWAVTGELVRVTELYVDTCDSSNKKLNKKTLSDCIPVLKPVPGILENTQIMSKRVKSDVPQVEILPLSSVEKILNAALPDTKVKMVIIPYHATWRQNLVEPN